MALGPKLTFIKAGDVLVADTVMQNFQSVVDFLRAIPATNLLQYNYSFNATSKIDAVAIASTKYFGYQKVNIGAAPVSLEITAAVSTAVVGPFAAGTQIIVTWQKCTPSAASGPTGIDVWTDLISSITFNSANTGGAFVVSDAVGVTRYCQSASITAPPALTDGDWVRCKVETLGVANVDEGYSQFIIKSPLRS